jgi:hypothetical protein
MEGQTMLVRTLASSLSEALKVDSSSWKNERDLQNSFRDNLGHLLKEFNIPEEVEEHGRVFTGRIPDSRIGRIIFEHKKFGSLKTDSVQNDAIRGRKKGNHRTGGLIEYWISHAFDAANNSPSDNKLELFYNEITKSVGYAFDGQTMIRCDFVKGLSQLNDLMNIPEESGAVAEWLQNDAAIPWEYHTKRFNDIEDGFSDFFRNLLRKDKSIFNSTNLAKLFGPGGGDRFANDFIDHIHETLSNAIHSEKGYESTKIRWNHWSKFHGKLYGEFSEVVTEQVQQKFDSINETYGVDIRNWEEFKIYMFTLQTYLGILLKGIAHLLLSRIISIQCNLATDIATLPPKDVHAKFREMLVGDLAHGWNLNNFFEEDHFSWIALGEIWSDELREYVLGMWARLDGLDIGIGNLAEVDTNDMLRDFYHTIFPRKLRRALGEFFTPDWLVELTVEKSGFKGGIDDKGIDPTCGSGSFIINMIGRKKREMSKSMVGCHLLRHISESVIGFDINPISTIIAKTNYLLALGELNQHISILDEGLTIPVYQCDSVMMPTVYAQQSGHSSVRMDDPTGDNPDIPVMDRKLQKELWVRLQRCESPKQDWSEEHQTQFKHMSEKYSKMSDEDRKFCIFTIRNQIAPFQTVDATHVIGNPPWIAWKNMSEQYRNVSGDVWRSYGLFEFERGYDKATAHDDFAMAVTYVAADHYLSEGGTLSFILPRSFIQSSKGGRGFRKWVISKLPWIENMQPEELTSNEILQVLRRQGIDNIPARKAERVSKVREILNIQETHRSQNITGIYGDVNASQLRVKELIDLAGNQRNPKFTGLNPWGNESVPCMILNLEKGKQNSYPVTVVKLENKGQNPQPSDNWADIRGLVDEQIWQATPVFADDPLSQWFIAPPEEIQDFGKFSLSVLESEPAYKVIKGWEPSGAKGIHLLKANIELQPRKSLMKVINDSGRAKRPKPQEREGIVESQIVYPAISGADITVWKLKRVRNYALIPHLPEIPDNQSIVPLDMMENRFPQSLAWFKLFDGKDEEKKLRDRKLKGHKSLRRNPKLLEQGIVPPYAVDNIHPSSKGGHTWKEYKVVYNEQGEYGACVISSLTNEVFPDGQMIMPDSKTFFIGIDDKKEAYYVAGVMNAPFIRRMIHRFTSELTRGSEVHRFLNPPKYNPNDSLHNNIAELSEKIHELAKEGGNYDLLESKLDKSVRQIYGMD